MTVAGVDEMAAAAAAQPGEDEKFSQPGEDEKWENFAKNLEEATERKRKTKMDVEEGLEEIQADEPETGERAPKKMLDPRWPSAAEVAEHELMHLPYRNWCRQCVRGRGKELPHTKSKDVQK